MGLALLAGIGGAADRVSKAQQFYKASDQREQLAELKLALTQLLAEQKNTTTMRGQDLGKVKADADREQKANAVRDNLDHLWADSSMKYDLGQQAADTAAGNLKARNRGIDEQSGQFWLGTLPLGYQRDSTSQANAQLSATTAVRGQDVAAETSRGNNDQNAAVAQRGQDMSATTAARGQDTSAYTAGVRGSGFGNLFSVDPAAASAAPPAPRPGAAAAPPARVAPPTRAPLPVRGRGAMATPPAAAAPAATPAAAATSAAPKVVHVGDLQKLLTLPKYAGKTLDDIRALYIQGGYAVVQ